MSFVAALQPLLLLLLLLLLRRQTNIVVQEEEEEVTTRWTLDESINLGSKVNLNLVACIE